MVAAPPAAPDAGRFSWQKAHAKVTAAGDLEWAPLPFVFQPGKSVRYIDFENGNDDKPGNPTPPWKHHPWDAYATGKAAQCTGIQTYVFKRGVIYRGALVAKESGRPGNPIRLTSDPSWDKGDASLYGSKRITGAWTRANAQSAPGVPSPEAVWYKDIGTEFTPHAVWMAAGGVITRIPLARDPNWKVSNPDDVKSEWYEWEKTDLTTATIEGKPRPRVWAADSTHLTATGQQRLRWRHRLDRVHGGHGDAVRCPHRGIRPGAPRDSFGRSFWRPPHRADYRPVPHSRYFLENLPQVLDVPGEYYFAQQGPLAGRLYVRLPREQDPNGVAIEIAERPTIVDIREQSHIHISRAYFPLPERHHVV